MTAVERKENTIRGVWGVEPFYRKNMRSNGSAKGADERAPIMQRRASV